MSAGHKFPSVEVVGRARKRANALCGQQSRLDDSGYAARDLVLHRENVAELAVVAFGPMVAAAYRVDELRGDAQALALTAHAAFEDVADTKLPANQADVGVLAFVLKGRVARDDEQPANARKSGDQVLGDAVGKVLLVSIVAHVDERQNRDRRTVGQGQRTRVAMSNAGGVENPRFADDGYRLDQTIAAAMARLDVTGGPRVIAERLAQLLNA